MSDSEATGTAMLIDTHRSVTRKREALTETVAHETGTAEAREEATGAAGPLRTTVPAARPARLPSNATNLSSLVTN